MVENQHVRSGRARRLEESARRRPENLVFARGISDVVAEHQLRIDDGALLDRTTKGPRQLIEDLEARRARRPPQE